MRNPIVKDNDIDFEYIESLSPLECRIYKGIPFTGTLLEEDGKSHTEYEGGCAHGQSVRYYASGKRWIEQTFEHGYCISKKEWYENGKPKETNKHVYDEDNKIIRINESWLYPNGQKINVYRKNEKCYFSPQGELAITIPKDSVDTYIYYDAILSECFQELIYNYYPQNYEFSRFEVESFIWGWAMKKYSVDKNKGIEIYTELTNSKNSNVADTASYLLAKLSEGAFTPQEYLEGQHIYLK